MGRPRKKRERAVRHGMTRRDFMIRGASAAACVMAAASLPQVFPYGSLARADVPFDFIIRDGSVYDGISSDPVQMDIGIKGELITAVGMIKAEARRVIDAAGIIVTPGFIDIHTHCDETFRRAGWKRHLAGLMPSWRGNYNYLYQGVTSVVTGNCGYGYTDTDQWLSRVDSLGFGSNVYHLVPHGVLREELFGENQPENLSGDQMDLLKQRVREEMDKGAVGLSFGLEYAPGILAPFAEVADLARVVKGYGGLVTIHRRDETGRIHSDGRPGTLRSTEEAVEVARSTGVRVQISHIKIARPFSGVKPSQVLDIIEGARAQGLDVSSDHYPYDASSANITLLLPDAFKRGLTVRDEYRSSQGRREIREAIQKVFAYLGPERILISMYPANDAWEGKTLSAISEETRMPADALFADMACEDPSPMGVFFSMESEDVKAFMQPGYMLTSTDGWTVPKGMTKPHPRCYGAFARKVHDYVFSERVVGLAQAIRSMTSLPAERFGIKGRGIIREGAYADVAMIDLKNYADHATYLDPHQYASGIRHLLVNGRLGIDQGQATGDRGGRALRRG